MAQDRNQGGITTTSGKTDITARCILVVRYRYLGTFYRSNFKTKQFNKSDSSWTSCTLKMGPVKCVEMSITNYQPRPRTITEESLKYTAAVTRNFPP